ncbi:MAG: polysaccharide biosynthesis protein [Lachnospiraceae bacterium]|jgi:O-antigen/teichoic acid export membrane protein|nr:polysaccharide biosynthesis protein [uncultured Acetatifactor sp.]MCI9572232.1 polysaccharide biosynthesis protein [Lachnospiraceae bacterium]
MGEKTRSSYAVKNVSLGYICTFLTDIFAFVNRTVLVWILGNAYVGVNGLFTDVLGVLSFAELGIGTALNFSLYKPVAEYDENKIKSLMCLYRTAYRTIAFSIAAIGLGVLPFLRYVVKDPGDIGDIRVYYCVFLFNTVTSYFVSYKYSLVNARQENYLFSVINMLTKCVSAGTQLIILYASKNYFWYLMAGAIVELLQKVWAAWYLNKRYPILCERNCQPLEKSEKEEIWKNVRALIWHKVGDVSVHQTDNIIVSAFIDIATVGRVTYYNSFILAANQMLSVAMNSVIGSLGNALSCEGTEKKYELFKTYRFVAFWLYGYISIGLYLMLSKLVGLLVGPDMFLPNIVIFLIVLNFYMMGNRIAVNNMKVAGGVFQQDKFVAVLQAGINLVSSILLVRLVGLPGVYMGTILQGLLSTVVKPVIVYKAMFNRKATEYFLSGMKYIIAVFMAGLICLWVDCSYFQAVTQWSFLVEIILISGIINIIFLVLFAKTKEFQYLWKMMQQVFGRN